VTLAGAPGVAPTHPWERAGLDRVLSHDVRGALRGVTSFLTLLGRELTEAEETAGEYHATAAAAAGRADVMVERIVHLLRLDLRPLELGPVDLGQVVAATTARLADEQATAPNVDAGTLPTVWADRALIAECVAELITNAHKFSDGAATIDVSTTRTVGPWVYLSVSDDGPGVEPQFAEDAFALFRLLQPKGRFAGVGMGLPIARRIAEVHGGRLWIAAHDGPGTTVCIRLLSAA
jgi:signal transduction histidine kinase